MEPRRLRALFLNQNGQRDDRSLLRNFVFVLSLLYITSVFRHTGRFAQPLSRLPPINRNSKCMQSDSLSFALPSPFPLARAFTCTKDFIFSFLAFFCINLPFRARSVMLAVTWRKCFGKTFIVYGSLWLPSLSFPLSRISLDSLVHTSCLRYKSFDPQSCLGDKHGNWIRAKGRFGVCACLAAE